MTTSTYKRLLVGLIVACATAGVMAQNPVTVFQWGASVLTGAGTEANTLRVTLPTDGTGKVSAAQSGTWNITNVSGTVSLPTGASTEATLSTLNGKVPGLGQALAAASTPVVLTAAQLTTLTPPAAITGFSTEATLDARTGSLTEAAPATDTASSGLNGRLQRIAQRITSLITALGSPFQAGGSIGNTSFGSSNFPATVDTNSGNKSASTLRVVLATDQPALTNKLLVTPDSVALPANQSVNVAQMNGVTTAMDAGSSSTGTQRVVLADGLLEGPASGIVTTASTNAINVKAGAAQFFGYEIFNTTTTVYYLRLYNTVGAPTCSSATGFIRSVPIPPAGAAGGVGGAVLYRATGVAYGTGLAYCITGGASSTDNTNAAVGIFGTILYR